MAGCLEIEGVADCSQTVADVKGITYTIQSCVSETQSVPPNPDAECRFEQSIARFQDNPNERSLTGAGVCRKCGLVFDSYTISVSSPRNKT
jgi:hypothetical protein